MKKRSEQGVEMSVAEAMATAEAWNERAALLSTMAFELTSAFGGGYEGGEPPYLVKRLAGGATAANPAHLEEIRLELFAAAKDARAQARVILASAADACSDACIAGLSGDEVKPPVNHASIEIPSGGDEVVANPRCPASRRKLGDGPFYFEEEEEEQEEERGQELVVLHPDGPARRERHRPAAAGDMPSRARRVKGERS